MTTMQNHAQDDSQADGQWQLGSGGDESYDDTGDNDGSSRGGSDNSALTPLAGLLKSLREARGLSLYALQDLSGINRSNLSRMEAGTLVHVTPATLQKLANALEVDVEDFYEAHWQTTGQPLPSMPVYFRTKHRTLTNTEIAEIEAYVLRVEEEHLRAGVTRGRGERSKEERGGETEGRQDGGRGNPPQRY